MDTGPRIVAQRPGWHYGTAGGLVTLVPTLALGYFAMQEAKAQIKAAKSVSVAQVEAEVRRLELQAENFRVSYDALLQLCLEK